VKVFRVRLPPEAPEEIHAVDQDGGLVQSNIRRRKWLADTVGSSYLIAIH
jgi:hypothetical protein